jgi:hypothetical protein
MGLQLPILVAHDQCLSSAQLKGAELVEELLRIVAARTVPLLQLSLLHIT